MKLGTLLEAKSDKPKVLTDDEIIDLMSSDLQIDEDVRKLDNGQDSDFNVKSLSKPEDAVGITLDYAEQHQLVPKDPRVAKDIFDKILFKLINIKGKPGSFINIKRARVLNVLLPRIAKFSAVRLLKMFIKGKLNRFSENKMNKYFNDGKMHAWFRTEIDKIYKAHPEYRNIPMDEFKDSNLFEYNAAEWRDKSKDQLIRRLGHRSLTIILLILFCKIPLPWKFMNSLYAIPAKILLGYFGINLATGSINQFAIDFENETLMMGLSLTRATVEITNPELVVRRRDGKMVRVDLPQVPKELYFPTESEIKYFISHEPSIEDIRAEVERFNESS